MTMKCLIKRQEVISAKNILLVLGEYIWQREVIPPEIDELIALLNEANEFDTELAPVLALAATTGLRRGELSGLTSRSRRLRLAPLARRHGRQRRWRHRRDQDDEDPPGTLAEHRPGYYHDARSPPRRNGRPRRNTRYRGRRRRVRVLAGARLLGADATRVHDPPHATAPDNARSHQRERRGIDPCTPQVHKNRARPSAVGKGTPFKSCSRTTRSAVHPPTSRLPSTLGVWTSRNTRSSTLSSAARSSIVFSQATSQVFDSPKRFLTSAAISTSPCAACFLILPSNRVHQSSGVGSTPTSMPSYFATVRRMRPVATHVCSAAIWHPLLPIRLACPLTKQSTTPLGSTVAIPFDCQKGIDRTPPKRFVRMWRPDVLRFQRPVSGERRRLLQDHESRARYWCTADVDP